MNIVIAVNSYWPNKDGVQMVTQYEAEKLVELGHNVTVMTSMVDGCKKDEIHNGVRIIRFIHKCRLKYHYGEKSAFQNFLIANNDKIDVFIAVCVHNIPFLWTRSILNKMKCRKVLYMHGMRPEHINFKKLHDLKHLPKELILTPYWNVFFLKNWKKITKFDATCHLFENDESNQYFKKHGYKNNYIIPNCCEDELFAEYVEEDKSYFLKKYYIDKPYFLLVANFDTRKNQKEALLSYYNSEINKCTLVFIGSTRNKYAEELEDMNEQLSSKYPCKEKPLILYNISREDTRMFIKASYAILMVSQNEFFPITIVEGMASRKPFISSNVGMVSKLPGGNIYHDTDELNYWLNYYQLQQEYVYKLGQIAYDYADKNMRINVQIRRLENILLSEDE